MTIRHYATIGTVSAGTLRDDDLLAAFAGELEYHVIRNKRCRGLGLPAKRKLIREAYNVAEDEDVSDLIQDLQDALQDFAPPYTYFGALEGDGCDFGFWPDPDVGVDDDLLPRFADMCDVPAGFRGDCVLINDHGNMSVGFVNGRHEFKRIWDCV